MALGQNKTKIEEQKKKIEEQTDELEISRNTLEDQQDALAKLEEKTQTFIEQVTGVLEEEKTYERIKILQTLSEAIGSDSNVEMLLSTKSRVDALTDPNRLHCSTQTVNFGKNKSCTEHSDFIPKASCPIGKSIRSINIVARKVPGGWGCGFELECCSNIGVFSN